MEQHIVTVTVQLQALLDLLSSGSGLGVPGLEKHVNPAGSVVAHLGLDGKATDGYGPTNV